MIKPVSFYQGDSSPILMVRPDVIDPTQPLSADWVCKESLVGEDNTVFIPPRIVTEKNDEGTHWVLCLTPEDTVLVDVVKNFTRCKWVIQVSNEALTKPYSKELHKPLNIKKQGIA